MNHFNLKPLLVLFCGGIMLASCQKESMENSVQVADDGSLSMQSDPKSNTFKGPQVEWGHGYARSWITLTHDDVPVEIGIEITGDAINTLGSDPGAIEDHHTTVLPLHQKAIAATAFEHIGINWNPGGHPPPGVFTVPHFDFHFYMITNEERMAIPTYAEDPTGFDDEPVGDYAPQQYFNPPFGGTAEPEMGSHWVPVNLGAFLPFSKIMIYGSYAGKVHFIEPMITLAYITANNSMNNVFPTPLAYPEPGYYPSAYNMWHDEKHDRYYVSLSNFIKFPLE